MSSLDACVVKMPQAVEKQLDQRSYGIETHHVAWMMKTIPVETSRTVTTNTFDVWVPKTYHEADLALGQLLSDTQKGQPAFLAVDTERTTFFHKDHKTGKTVNVEWVQVISLCDGKRVVVLHRPVLDPLSRNPFERRRWRLPSLVGQLMRETRVPKVFFALHTDLGPLADTCMQASMAPLHINSLTCLQATARIMLGMPRSAQDISLSTLTKTVCGFPLDKSMVRSNWSVCPVTYKQVTYIACDVLATWFCAYRLWTRPASVPAQISDASPSPSPTSVMDEEDDVDFYQPKAQHTKTATASASTSKLPTPQDWPSDNEVAALFKATAAKNEKSAKLQASPKQPTVTLPSSSSPDSSRETSPSVSAPKKDLSDTARRVMDVLSTENRPVLARYIAQEIGEAYKKEIVNQTLYRELLPLDLVKKHMINGKTHWFINPIPIVTDGKKHTTAVTDTKHTMDVKTIMLTQSPATSPSSTTENRERYAAARLDGPTFTIWHAIEQTPPAKRPSNDQKLVNHLWTRFRTTLSADAIRQHLNGLLQTGWVAKDRNGRIYATIV